MMIPKLIAATPLSNYTLKLYYDNDEIKKFSLTPFLHLPIYKELKNEEIFKNISINFNTIQWGNNIDIDPESLYNLSVRI